MGKAEADEDDPGAEEPERGDADQQPSHRAPAGEVGEHPQAPRRPPVGAAGGEPAEDEEGAGAAERDRRRQPRRGNRHRPGGNREDDRGQRRLDQEHGGLGDHQLEHRRRLGASEPPQRHRPHRRRPGALE
jgi:hypothetical protein